MREAANRDLCWREAPSPLPALTGPCVHVWLAELASWRGHHGALVDFLSAPERERAARLVSPEQRANWEMTRALLRRLLASQLGLAPGAVGFQYGPLGKPALADGAAGEWHFNVSHSAGLAVFALTRSGAVGVDIERVRPRTANWREIARRFLPADEVAVMDSLPEDEGQRVFFACWTRHEAATKATGGSVFAQRGAAATGGLTLAMLPEVPGFYAALATEVSAPTIHCWRLLPGIHPDCPGAIRTEGHCYRLPSPLNGERD